MNGAESFFLGLLSAGVLLYSLGAWAAVWGLRRHQDPKAANPPSRWPVISVVLAARNEAENIADCLAALCAQDYPLERYEIIVVDDHSTDGTREIAERFGSQVQPRVRVLALGDLGDPNLRGKQHALDLGIRASRGEIIANTDADCVPPPSWLRTIAERMTPETDLLLGFSQCDRPGDGSGLFAKLQSLELIGLFGADVAALSWGQPLACTGNNLAYRRRVYEVLGGFSKLGETVHDDNLFLLWIQQQSRFQMRAVFCPETTVVTRPMSSWKAFLRQRLRWATASAEVSLPALWFAVVLYGTELLVLLALIGGGIGWVSPAWSLALVGLKWLPEWCLLLESLRRLRRYDLTRYLLPVVLFHGLYVVLVGVPSLLAQIEWKDRKVPRTPSATT
ncbi:MAG: hypothetical protein KatS3mg115_0931 [Candidatus Poribacteria bacterium]|nr:MAG: hypothetical protein KatS3mg115_0931 [Candidatus Poribacteria bacterium]